MNEEMKANLRGNIDVSTGQAREFFVTINLLLKKISIKELTQKLDEMLAEIEQIKWTEGN